LLYWIFEDLHEQDFLDSVILSDIKKELTKKLSRSINQ
jgi:hypothetical protein